MILLNPRVVDSSPDTDEQYEGCLSFFDHRGWCPGRCASTWSTRSATAAG